MQRFIGEGNSTGMLNTQYIIVHLIVIIMTAAVNNVALILLLCALNIRLYLSFKLNIYSLIDYFRIHYKYLTIDICNVDLISAIDIHISCSP